MRLQAVAKNERVGGCDGPVMITIHLFVLDGAPVGWFKPTRTPLEPRSMDLSLLPLERLDT